MWKETYNSTSTDNKTQRIVCELWLEFEQSKWNMNLESPIMRLDFYDKKTVTSWPICKPVVCKDYPKHDCTDCRIYHDGLRRQCTIHFNYFQRMPDVTLYSNHKDGDREKDINLVDYDDFTLEYCKNKAIKIFKQNIENIVKQL